MKDGLAPGNGLSKGGGERIPIASKPQQWQGHSGENGNAAKLVGKMSKSVMWLISIHF